MGKRKHYSPVERNEQVIYPRRRRKQKKPNMATGTSGTSGISPPPVNLSFSQSPQTPFTSMLPVNAQFSIPQTMPMSFPFVQPSHVFQQPSMQQTINPGSPPQFQLTQPSSLFLPCIQVTGQVTGQSKNSTGSSDNTQMLLMNIVQRLDGIDEKLGQLKTIQSSISRITERLNSMELKLSDLEQSQSFVSDKYDSLNDAVNMNKDVVKNLETEVEKLRTENTELKALNSAFKDDVTDLRCRSMRDNLLFFGIPEETYQSQQVSQNVMDVTNQDDAAATGGNPTPDGNPVLIASQTRREDCERKVLEFCSNVLKIENAADVIQIDVAHRVGRFVRGKNRPVVARFMNTSSKMRVKSALRNIDLRQTPFNVSEQYPNSVLNRRKELIDVMKMARRDGNRAVLVRDKLFINGQLYVPKPVH